MRLLSPSRGDTTRLTEGAAAAEASVLTVGEEAEFWADRSRRWRLGGFRPDLLE